MDDRTPLITSLEHQLSGGMNFKDSSVSETSGRRMEKSELSDKPTSVSVSASGTSQAFIFTHQDYLVRTEPTNWSVIRKYSDFLWLRRVLSKEFPHYALPVLPKMADRYQESKVSMKLKYLGLFMSKLVSSETLKSSKALIAFLKEEDKLEFKQSKKGFNRIKNLKSIDLFQSKDGVIKLSDQDNISYYCKNKYLLGTFYDQINNLHKKAKAIVKKSNNLSSAIMDFSEECEKMANFEWIDEGLTEKTKSVFREFSDIYKTISYKQNDYSSIFENFLVYPVDYTTYQIKPLRDLINTNNKIWVKHTKIRTLKENKQTQGNSLSEKEHLEYRNSTQFLGCFNYKCRKHIDKRIYDWMNTLVAELNEFSDKMIERKPEDIPKCLPLEVDEFADQF